MIFTAGYVMFLLIFIIGCVFDSNYRKTKTYYIQSMVVIAIAIILMIRKL
jgi:hypothetical protein|nr:MAG TPA: TMEM119 family [Caudoviricetes sp.]